MEDRGRHRNNKGTKYRILAVISLGLVLICTAVLAKYLVDTARARKQMEDIRNDYVVNAGGSGGETGLEALSAERARKEALRLKQEEEARAVMLAEAERLDLMERYAVPDRMVDFAALHEEFTTDIYAWIEIPDTVIDYPVLQNAEDTDYYLTHNLDGTGPRPGCIYTQNINSKDFTDRNTVIYGHNMSGGDMFHDLHKYGDSVFFEEHPYFYIYTEEGVLVYQVFAACVYSSIHLLEGIDISLGAYFQRYINSLYASDGLNSNFNTGIKEEIDAESRIVTLSTCTNPTRQDKRWLVSAVLRQRIPYRDAEALEAAMEQVRKYEEKQGE